MPKSKTLYQRLRRVSQKKRRVSSRRRSRKSYRGSKGLSGVLRSLSRSIRRSSYPAEYAANKATTRRTRRQVMKLLRDGDATGAGLISKANQIVRDAVYNPLDPKRLFGRGGYWGRMFGNWLGGLTGNSTIKSLAASAFDSAGDYISSSIPGGDLIASGAEALHKSISGRGDYSINDAMSQSVPSFGGGEVDFVRVRSREYLGPVSGSSDFKHVARLVLNPGNHAAFPQLAKLAAHYQQYIMRGCIFYYKTTSSVAVNTADPALGQVIMAANYDASEPNYASKAEMMQSQYCSSGAPCQDIIHGIECAAFSNGSEVKRIRHGEPSESVADPLNTDVGTFQLAVEGTNAAATRIGELWVTYDVMLIKGKDSKGSEIPTCDLSFSSCDRTYILGSGIPSVSVNTLAITTSDPGLPGGFWVNRNTIVFPRFIDDGKYRLDVHLINPSPSNPLAQVDQATVPNGFTAVSPPVIVGSGCTATPYSPFNEMVANVTGGNADLQVAATVVFSYLVDVRTSISQPVAMLKFSSGVGFCYWPCLKSGGSVRLVISRVPDLLNV